jgi:hypothetical protein
VENVQEKNQFLVEYRRCRICIYLIKYKSNYKSGGIMHAEMPKVNKCDVVKCVYNSNRYCNTIAITVGGMTHACPQCDTAAFTKQKAGIPFVNGEVGACRQTNCKYNSSWECNAQQGITVAMHKQHPDCMTYEAKEKKMPEK